MLLLLWLVILGGPKNWTLLKSSKFVTCDVTKRHSVYQTIQFRRETVLCNNFPYGTILGVGSELNFLGVDVLRTTLLLLVTY